MYPFQMFYPNKYALHSRWNGTGDGSEPHCTGNWEGKAEKRTEETHKDKGERNGERRIRKDEKQRGNNCGGPHSV